MSLGLGMDLNWGKNGDFVVDETGREKLRPSLSQFIRRHDEDFQSAFFSLQPRTADLLHNDEALTPMLAAYREFQSHLPSVSDWGLHHTFLNLGTLEENYPREAIARVTNRVTRALGLGWINEDLGLWSLLGKNLAYPLPPVLTADGLAAACENIRFFQGALEARLRVEFPGFNEGNTILLGDLCALEFFRECIHRTGVDCVLDTGHILGYQWRQGRRGVRMLESLEELLPFPSCVEIHLSGCSIVGDRFMDFHHGILQEEQFTLLDFLLERCSNLKTVTYEDPKFLEDGTLIPKATSGYERLRERVKQWQATVAA